MQQELQRILELQPNYDRRLTPLMKRRGELLRNESPKWLDDHRDVLAPAAGVPIEDFLAEGSDGRGLKARVPWVRFASRRFSPRAKNGFYVVYLFDGPGGFVYMSLNQGTSEGDSFNSQPVPLIEARTSWARGVLANWIGQRDDTLAIELHDHGSLAKQYELGNVAAVAYERGSIPDESVLLRDAREYADALGTLYSAHETAPLPDEAPEVAHAEELADRAAGKTPRSSGAGFRTDAQDVKAIELHAVALARRYYEDEGWKVTVLGKPYDLRLKRDGQTMHVEVKGTTSVGSQVVLTYNEVRHHEARRPANALVIVRDITLERTSSGPVASGGTLYERRGWNPQDSTLRPISYAYAVPSDLFDSEGVPAAALTKKRPRR